MKKIPGNTGSGTPPQNQCDDNREGGGYERPHQTGGANQSKRRRLEGKCRQVSRKTVMKAWNRRKNKTNKEDAKEGEDEPEAFTVIRPARSIRMHMKCGKADGFPWPAGHNSS